MQFLEQNKKPKPWFRFYARLLDTYFCGIFFGLSGSTAIVESNLSIGIILLFFWIFVEAAFLCLFKTTPGKALFNIHIVGNNNRRLSYLSALKRSFLVWFRGMGAGVPIIVLFTYIWGYSGLTTKGVTSWDLDTKSTVIHHKIGWVRAIFIFLSILLLILILIGSRIQ